MQHKIGQNLSPFASVYGWGKPTYTVHVYTFAIIMVHIFQGNHEYYTMDAGNWLTHLDSLGINVLHNSNRQIPSEGDPKEQLCMAGVDDIEADRIM